VKRPAGLVRKLSEFKTNPHETIEKRLVRLAGLEPARVTPLPPQSSVSANSTISALVTNEAALSQLRKVILQIG
jgi:hypothetical protein